MSSNLFIITAPSGAGKTTLIKKVLEFAQSHDEKVLLSVSHTTRSPRDGEKHGKDYLFISENEFGLKLRSKPILLFFCLIL